jgi:hypothetical protein
MKRASSLLGVLALAACNSGPVAPAAGEGRPVSALGDQAISSRGQEMQGPALQGQPGEGAPAQDAPGVVSLAAGVPAAPVVTHRLDRVTLGGALLADVRVERGALVAARNGRTLRGGELLGAELTGESETGELARYRISAVRPELERYAGGTADGSAADGATLLYTLEKRTADRGWAPLCGTDADGLSAAIPLAAAFDSSGARTESATRITFACTGGALAKCYRWGYQPWRASPAGPGAMAALHQACTRMARADYCGDGLSRTHAGTRIRYWDDAGVQPEAPPAEAGWLFEAGWAPQGAVCLSKERWLQLSVDLAAACPDRLIPPGVSVGGASVCSSAEEALAFPQPAQLFNASEVRLDR